MSPTIHCKTLFETSYENLFLLERFLNEFVFDYDDFLEDFNFEELKEGLFHVSFSINENELYTPYTDFLYSLNYTSKILLFDCHLEENNKVISIHRFENNQFNVYFVEDKEDFQKRKIVNSAFEEEETIHFPIHTKGKRIRIQTKLFNMIKTFYIYEDNLKYGADFKKNPIYVCEKDERIELCKICSNRLICVMDERVCKFSTI